MSVFSPLALTQTLPFLPLAQGDIDYEVARRGEPDLFAKVLAEPATKVILVKDGKVAVPHGQGAIADYANVKMRLAQLPGAYVAAELESHPSALAIFLGSYGGRLGEHVVAVDVTHVQPNDTTMNPSNKDFDEYIKNAQSTSGTERDEWLRKAEQLLIGDEMICIPVLFPSLTLIIDESVVEGVYTTVMGQWMFDKAEPVSYTHLTLPTKA